VSSIYTPLLHSHLYNSVIHTYSSTPTCSDDVVLNSSVIHTHSSTPTYLATTVTPHRYFEAEMQAQVGPGLKKSELNDLLAPFGMLFGPDPASNPSLGGMASTRGSGLSTLMYGTTAENVVSLLVVTPEGRLVRTRRRVRKSATGYELTQLYVGSEGTLGVIVELTVRVRRLPKVSNAICVPYHNTLVDQG
jgi:FAD/FMN-containing dehydrogenase